MKPTTIMFVGDLHGNIDRADELIDIAAAYSCDAIVQVGDWGFIWPSPPADRVAYKKLSRLLVAANIPMYFCDGNHDVHPILRKLPQDRLDNVDKFITYQSRGSFRAIKDVNLVFLGGAASIDYKWRKPDHSWWLEEIITEEETQRALTHTGKTIDILVSHEAAKIPLGLKETSDVVFNKRAKQCCGFIKETIEKLNPTIHVHGHYHSRYTSKHKNTIVEGLGADVNYIDDNYLIYKKEKPNNDNDTPEEPKSETGGGRIPVDA